MIVKDKINFFKQFITENRYKLFEKIIQERTRYISVLLEDIYRPQNASAVLRTCDCFGVQDVHIIENHNEYRINPDVALGASKWLTLKKYNNSESNTPDAIQTLKAQGYRMVATSPHSRDTTPESFDIEKGKFVLMFGSEKPGLSSIVFDNADEFLSIPMYGFTESFNISVSAAIILNRLSRRLRETAIDYRLPPESRNEILLQWLRKSVKNPDALEEKFNQK